MMRAPLMFFDQTPIGRILSRFSSDQEATDNKFPEIICWLIYTLFEVNNLKIFLIGAPNSKTFSKKVQFA